MKKILFVIGYVCVFTLCLSAAPTAHASQSVDSHSEEKHDYVDKEKFQQLVDEGYSKKEIMKAVFFAKHSEANIEDILTNYKETGDWEKTAEHFQVNLEELKKEKEQMRKKHKEFLEKNEDKIMGYLAEYTEENPQTLNKYKDDISITYMIKAAAISNISDKEFSEVVQLMQDGKKVKDIMQSLGVEKESFGSEMKSIREDMKKLLK